ncbi:MAG: NADH-quinone oxidoreductase subunit K [Deltaproteobacteria bacterium]|nr:NADH-quinone oxidoreductase subunit K [Deltaproteobacteria bacterium]
MQVEVYLILSATLVGIGIGSALSRRNIISIVVAVITAGTGALIAMATVGHGSDTHDDGMLFAMVLGAILLVLMTLGCALAYRRFMSTGTTNISDANELRH